MLGQKLAHFKLIHNTYSYGGCAILKAMRVETQMPAGFDVLNLCKAFHWEEHRQPYSILVAGLNSPEQKEHQSKPFLLLAEVSIDVATMSNISFRTLWVKLIKRTITRSTWCTCIFVCTFSQVGTTSCQFLFLLSVYMTFLLHVKQATFQTPTDKNEYVLVPWLLPSTMAPTGSIAAASGSILLHGRIRGDQSCFWDHKQKQILAVP